MVRDEAPADGAAFSALPALVVMEPEQAAPYNAHTVLASCSQSGAMTFAGAITAREATGLS
jgi:hypothetical protein